MRRVRISHKTSYRYAQQTGLGLQTIALRPLNSTKHTIVSFHMSLDPSDIHVSWVTDMFGNLIARCMVPHAVDHFNIDTRSELTLEKVNPFNFFLDERAARFPVKYTEAQLAVLGAYLVQMPAPEAEAILDSATAREGANSLDLLLRLSKKIADDFAYKVRDEMGVQDPTTTLVTKTGSCRDLAWLLVALFRKLGIAARFVSGYLLQVSIGDSVGAPFSRADFHAWTEAYLPGAGWVGFDPTSGLLCAEQHVAVATAPHFEKAGPVRGTHGATGVSLCFKVDVEEVA